MAKKEEASKIVLERKYIVNLRRYFIREKHYRTTKRAVTGLYEFLQQHMKQEDRKNIKIGKYLNEKIWQHGIRNPPPRVEIIVKKDDKGIVYAELAVLPKSGEKKVKKAEDKKVKEDKKAGVKPKEEKKAEKKEDKKEKPAKEEKKEDKKSEENEDLE